MRESHSRRVGVRGLTGAFMINICLIYRLFCPLVLIFCMPTHGTSRSVIDPQSFPYSFIRTYIKHSSTMRFNSKGLTQKKVLPPLSFVKINKIPNHVIICHVFNCFMLVKSKADKCDEWIIILDTHTPHIQKHTTKTKNHHVEEF